VRKFAQFYGRSPELLDAELRPTHGCCPCCS
jgi:hypothetical protein